MYAPHELFEPRYDLYPKFVNHVFNSHQLSNKALLAGHLQFHQCHYFVEDSDKYVDGGQCVEGQVQGHVEPDMFFPRCWDVSNGGLPSLLRAFAVSGAIALIRDYIQSEVRPMNRLCPSAATWTGHTYPISICFLYIKKKAI